MDTSKLPLREQKRINTHRALSTAALRLCLERGYAAVTVDDIAAAAGVSTRTFFNYFPTKEEAVLGPAPLPLTEEQKEEFLHAEHPDLLVAGLELLVDSIIQLTECNPVTEEIIALRQDLLKATPELHQQHFARFHSAHEEVHHLLVQYLKAHPGRCATGDPEVDARVLTGMIGASLQTSFLLRNHPLIRQREGACPKALAATVVSLTRTILTH